MILGGEIALIVVGLAAMFTGKLTLSKGKVVRGMPARMLGLIGLAPIPLTLACMFLTGVVFGVLRKPIEGVSHWWFVLMEFTILILCAVAIYGIGGMYVSSASTAHGALPRRLPPIGPPEETNNPFQPPRQH